MVAIHNDYLVVAVELVSELLAKGLDTVLEEGLFSVNVKRTVALISILGEGISSLSKPLKFHEIFSVNVTKFLSDLLLKSRHILFEVEHVSTSVSCDGCHLTIM